MAGVCSCWNARGIENKNTFRPVARTGHIHSNRYDYGTVHMHAHGYKHGHRQSSNTQGHLQFFHRLYFRTFAVGMMHKMASEVALIVFVAAASAGSAHQGIGYIGMFGFCSVLGMAVLSVVIVFLVTYVVLPYKILSLAEDGCWTWDV